MSLLRVLLRAAPDAHRADAWALFDDQGRRVQSGHGTPATWPGAVTREAVLSASCVRIAALRLPPLSPDRVAPAATFALEDQLAGPAGEQHIAVSRQDADGRVEAIIASRELVRSLATDFDRVLAEPSLAPRGAADRWCWYASEGGGGFVRRPDGSAFAVGVAHTVPAELTLALDHARHAGDGAIAVDVRFASDATTLAEFSRLTGTSFHAAQPWTWQDAGRDAFARSTDLLQGDFAHHAPDTGGRSLRHVRLAMGVAAAAIALHVVFSAAQWAFLRVEDWRATSALAALARDAGAAQGVRPAAAVESAYADARHRAMLPAPTDALPMLALAAPALATLPPGTLRSATYAQGHWTFDLAPGDDAQTADLARQLAAAGLGTLQATNASGTRLRVSLVEGAQ